MNVRRDCRSFDERFLAPEVHYLHHRNSAQRISQRLVCSRRRIISCNVFNRVRFGTGSTQLQSTQFGVLVGAGSQINAPRALQLALKFYF